MKKTFKQHFAFILTFFIGLTAVLAQGFNLPTDYIRNSIQGNNIKLEKTQGSPYLPVEFVLGKVNINKDTYAGLLRYNAFNDEIELKENSGQIISLLKRPYIKASIDNASYAIYPYSVDGSKIRQGYFVELTNTEANTLLLIKQKKVLIPAQEASSSYKKGSPAKLVDELSYYVIEGDKEAKPLKLGKKKVLSFFNNKPELKSYVAENKLKLKSKTDLVRFINYINTL